MLAYWDADQRCRFANRAYETWFGVSPESLIGTQLKDLLGPELYRLNRPYIEAALAGEPQQFERAVPHPSGGPPRHSLASYLPDVRDGVVHGFFVIVTDISEIKRAQLALAASETQQKVLAEAGAVLASSLDYEQTLKTIAKLVVEHVAEFCIIDMLEDDTKVRRLTMAHADPAKAALCERLATIPLDARHVLGRTALETREVQVIDDMTPQFIGGTARNDEHVRLLRELAPRSAIVVPLVATSGVLGALMFVSSSPGRFGARDVELATELGRRASLAIENARLYAAAKQASAARDVVLGVVAHDVRSPLNTIVLAGLALERQFAETGDVRGQKWVKLISSSVQRANRLIQDLLDVARLEAGALSIERRSVSPAQVVHDAFNTQQVQAQAASLELELEVEDDLPEILADDERLLQVLENLIGNAIKFTPAGGSIRLRAMRRPGEVLFAVSDSGCGIDADGLPHVFDRFWQARRSERRGAGLGLPICKGIVEAHGGRIWVESTPDRGTTFYFTIPTAPAAAAATAIH